MKRLLLFLSFYLANSQGYLLNVWKKAEFKKTILDNEPKWVQYITVKKGGQLTGFYDPLQNKMFANIMRSARDYYTLDLGPPVMSHIGDMDVEQWDSEIYLIHTGYCKTSQQHKIRFPDGLIVDSASPIHRCFTNLVDKKTLLSVVVFYNGTLLQQETTQKDSGYETSLISQPIPILIRLAEFFSPFVYLVDVQNRVHIFSPKKAKILHSFDFHYSSPIVRFHIFTTFPREGIRCTMGLHNGTVHMFTLFKNSTQLEDSVRIDMKKFSSLVEILAVYSDMYKTLITTPQGVYLLDTVDTTVTGEAQQYFYRTTWKIDTNYFTRMYVSHQSIMTDGNPEGLVRYSVGGGGSGGKENKNTDEDLENKPRLSSGFLQSILQSPAYSIEQRNANWSHVLPKDNSTEI